MPDLRPLSDAIEAGDRKSAVALTTDALAAGIEPQSVLDAMTAAMGVVGSKFSARSSSRRC